MEKLKTVKNICVICYKVVCLYMRLRSKYKELHGKHDPKEVIYYLKTLTDLVEKEFFNVIDEVTNAKEIV